MLRMKKSFKEVHGVEWIAENLSSSGLKQAVMILDGLKDWVPGLITMM